MREGRHEGRHGCCRWRSIGRSRRPWLQHRDPRPKDKMPTTAIVQYGYVSDVLCVCVSVCLSSVLLPHWCSVLPSSLLWIHTFRALVCVLLPAAAVLTGGHGTPCIQGRSRPQNSGVARAGAQHRRAPENKTAAKPSGHFSKPEMKNHALRGTPAQQSAFINPTARASAKQMPETKQACQITPWTNGLGSVGGGFG